MGCPATGISGAHAPRGCSGGATGTAHHPRQPRRCLMRGRARAASHRCARGNAAHHRRGSHSGRSECSRSRATRSRRSDSSDVNARWSGARGRGEGPPRADSASLPRAQGNAGRHTTACPSRVAPRWARRESSGSMFIGRMAAGPQCARRCRLWRRRGGAQGTATPPERGATRKPVPTEETWGAMPIALAES